MTHTEKVHVVFGILAACMAILAIWSVYRPASRARFVWPVIILLIGFFLFIPVEAQTRTYKEVSWWGTLLSAVPQNPSYWFNNWFAKLTQWHVVQHKIAGALIMVVGAIEWQRARGRCTATAWKWTLPLLFVGIGAFFGVHGGNAEHLPNRIEQVQHHVFGIACVIAGMSLALVETGRVQGRGWRALWAIVILIDSLYIAFFYRLDPSVRGTEVHHHESAGTGQR